MLIKNLKTLNDNPTNPTNQHDNQKSEVCLQGPTASAEFYGELGRRLG